MGFSSSNYTFINTTGTIQPETQDIQDQIIQEYKDAFSDQSLITTPDTPQGALIAAETIARTNFIQNNAQIANQINPNLSGGVFLDALCALTGLSRSLQTYSTIEINMTGVPGTVIPTSITIQDPNGNVYQNTEIVTLNSDGAASSTFQAIIPGPILTQANVAWIITNGVLGLETVNNTQASTQGTAPQSDNSLKRQRLNTLALQGQGLPLAIQSGLYNLDPTVNLSFLENVSDLTQIIEGITLLPHSIYVCVSDAGYTATQGKTPNISDYNVAYTLLSKKDAGCGWNNTGSFSQVGILNSTITVTGLSDTTVLSDLLYPSSPFTFFVVGNGIPSNTTVASVLSLTSITLSQSATLSTTSTLTFTAAIILSGTINTINTTVTGLSSTSNLWVGMSITGTGIPIGTTIASIISNTSLTLSLQPTVNATENLTFISPYGRTILVTDPVSGQIYPVLFDRPQLIPIVMQVTYKTLTAPPNVQSLITTAITNYVNGNLNQEPGFAVFNDVSAFEISAAIINSIPQLFVVNVGVSLSTPLSYESYIAIGANQQALFTGIINFIPI